MILPLIFLAATAPAPRALWVWEGGRAMRNDPVQRAEFFRFLAAPRGDRSKKIGLIFFAGAFLPDLKDRAEANRVRDFVRDAHRRGVKVEYLCGDKNWAKPEGHPEALDNLTAVLAYNRSSALDARFDGFQYDVEPYLIKPWPSKETINGYLNLLDKAVAEVRRSRQRLILGAAIPRWFDVPELGGLHKKVVDRMDYVAVMDYVDNAQAFVDDGRNEVEYAAKQGKKTWLGIETQELKDEPRNTYYAIGNAGMEEALAAANRVFGTSPGFGGVVIHYYDSYLKLRP